jgi:hypothetical protein
MVKRYNTAATAIGHLGIGAAIRALTDDVLHDDAQLDLLPCRAVHSIPVHGRQSSRFKQLPDGARVAESLVSALLAQPSPHNSAHIIANSVALLFAQ